MNEMIDRVAKAQWDLARAHGRVSEPWDEVSDELRAGGRELAKVAIEAMREPTHEISKQSWCEDWAHRLWPEFIDQILKETK